MLSTSINVGFITKVMQDKFEEIERLHSEAHKEIPRNEK